MHFYQSIKPFFLLFLYVQTFIQANHLQDAFFPNGLFSWEKEMEPNQIPIWTPNSENKKICLDPGHVGSGAFILSEKRTTSDGYPEGFLTHIIASQIQEILGDKVFLTRDQKHSSLPIEENQIDFQDPKSYVDFVRRDLQNRAKIAALHCQYLLSIHLNFHKKDQERVYPRNPLLFFLPGAYGEEDFKRNEKNLPYLVAQSKDQEGFEQSLLLGKTLLKELSKLTNFQFNRPTKEDHVELFYLKKNCYPTKEAGVFHRSLRILDPFQENWGNRRGLIEVGMLNSAPYEKVRHSHSLEQWTHTIAQAMAKGLDEVFFPKNETYEI